MQSTRITCLAVLFASFTATGLFADRPAPKAEKPQAEGGIAGAPPRARAMPTSTTTAS